MDYFQGIVTEFLVAKRSRLVNTEYMINLDLDGTYKKDSTAAATLWPLTWLTQ